MKRPEILFDRVSWKYRGSNQWSLQDVSLQIEEGDFVVVTGATGSGKTTFCRLINGLIPHGYPGTLRGRVYVNAEDTINKSISALSNHVGTVFEDPESQIIWTSVADEVIFSLENRQFSKEEIDKRLERVLRFLSLLDKKDKTPFELSGGQKQRLALAAVMACNPSIIVLDEPTSQMDPVGRREVFGAIEKVRREYNSTIIIVEHNVSELIPAADKMILLNDGKLVLFESPDKYYEDLELVKKFRGPIPEMVELGSKLRKSGLIQRNCLTLNHIYEEIKEKLSFSKYVSYKSVMQNFGKHALEAEDVYYTYPDGTAALRGVNLSIIKGEFVGIIGVNGSGKTTLAKTFNGLLKPSAGKIRVFEKPLLEYDSEKLVSVVGYVFQNPIHQIASKTVFDEVAFGMRNLGVKEKDVEETVNSLLKRFNLEKYRLDHPYNLSRADQFRMTLASVLAMGPNILVVDEPTTGQDLRQSYEIMDVLKEENSNGKTIVVITHHLRFIAEYIPRVIFMLGGKVVFDGSTRDAFSDPELLSGSLIDPPEVCKLAQLLSLSLNGKRPLTVDEAFRAIVEAIGVRETRI
jgi:energy-coupling factor transporter ATP-binding protein EcfA2